MPQTKAIFRFIQDSEKLKFKHSQCLLTISVGQQSHEGERLAATVNLINKSFKSCIITLHDSLQRYTIALDKKEDPQEFYQVAKKEGDLWLARNKQYLDNFTVLQNVIRWDNWLMHPNYQNKLNNMKILLEEEASFKAIFNSTVDEYLARYRKRVIDIANFDEARAHKLCFDYLVEECAVLCLWPELNCQFELYPGKHNAAVEETRHRLIFPEFPQMLKAVALGFNNRSDLPPQHFEAIQ